MRKLILFVMTSGLATVSGLVGCQSKNSDKPAENIVRQKDRFAPRLTIERGSEAVDLRTTRDVDLQDRIDLSAAASTKVHVQCGSLAAERVVTGAKIMLIDLVPDALVTRDLKKQPEPCALHFELQNEVGSVWLLAHHAVTVHDERTPDIRIGRDDGVDVTLVAGGPPSMESVRMRALLVGEPALLCEDAIFRGPRFDRVLSFSDLDFSRPEMREGRERSVLAARRFEACRAVVREGERVVAVSPLYRVQFPRAPLALIELPLDRVEGLKQYRAGGDVSLRELELRNPENFARHFFVDGDGFMVRADIMRKITYAHDRSAYALRAVSLDVPGQPAGAPRRQIVVPANGSIKLRLVFKRPGQLRCRFAAAGPTSGDDFVEAIDFAVLDPINMFELEDDGATLIQSYPLGADVFRQIAPFPIDYRWYGPYTNNCAWN